MCTAHTQGNGASTAASGWAHFDALKPEGNFSVSIEHRITTLAEDHDAMPGFTAGGGHNGATVDYARCPMSVLTPESKTLKLDLVSLSLRCFVRAKAYGSSRASGWVGQLREQQLCAGQTIEPIISLRSVFLISGAGGGRLP